MCTSVCLSHTHTHTHTHIPHLQQAAILKHVADELVQVREALVVADVVGEDREHHGMLGTRNTHNISTQNTENGYQPYIIPNQSQSLRLESTQLVDRTYSAHTQHIQNPNSSQVRWDKRDR